MREPEGERNGKLCKVNEKKKKKNKNSASLRIENKNEFDHFYYYYFFQIRNENEIPKFEIGPHIIPIPFFKKNPSVF